MFRVWYHPVYTDGIDPNARFPRTRYRDTHDELRARGAPVSVEEAPQTDTADLLLCHGRSYVDAFLTRALNPRIERRIGLRPWTPYIVERTRRIFGASMAATRWALAHDTWAGNLAGGTHHAFRDEGSGYCVFNDVAAAAVLAVRRGLRVLVIDLDVHQGDGTAALLADEPAAFTFSVHCAKNFPFRKQQSDLDVALPVGTGDEAYLASLEAHLPRLVATHRPDFVVYQAGVDPLAEDRLGKLELTREGLRRRNALVYACVGRRPLLVTMGGGYAEPIARAAEAHADVFEQAARGLATGRSAPARTLDGSVNA
ncbi:MAG: histone deacetylase [Myxococcota bacterium]